MNTCVVPGAANPVVPMGVIDRLLPALGTARLADAIHDCVRDRAPIARCGIFVYDEAAVPRRIFATSMGAAQVDPGESRRYLQRHHRFDRMRGLMKQADDADSTRMCWMRADEIDDADYRRSYGAVDVSERLSLLAAAGRGQWISINFYRHRTHGSFHADELDQVAALAPVLRSFAERHLQLVSNTDGRSVDECRARLAEMEPRLSDRELEVCALMLKGLTAEEIAGELGVRPSTVVCYRKRAYARLEVANFKETPRALLLEQPTRRWQSLSTAPPA